MTTRTTALATLLLLAVGGTLNAGPLDPPGGPVSPTMKTLDQVEPRIPVNAQTCPGDQDSVFKIDQPGSYYLTGDLVGEAGKSGIEITATGITLDLCGYTMRGTYETLAGVRFIEEQGQVRDVTIRNGRVSSFAGPGIDGAVVPNLVAEDLRIVSCANGIVAGSRARVSRCHLTDLSGYTALILTNSAIVEGCTILGPYKGIVATDALTVRDCTIVFAPQGGIEAGDGSLVRNVTMRQCSFYGIRLGKGAVVSGCTMTSTYAPIQTTGNNARIENCVITDCSGDAIAVASDSVITGCSVLSSTGNGIVAFTANLITDNNVGYCNQNGTWAGIRCNGALNRIDNNHLIASDIGLYVTGVDNFIVRNTVSGSATPYNVVAGNDMAPIVVNPGAAFTGATPWSNFAF